MQIFQFTFENRVNFKFGKQHPLENKFVQLHRFFWHFNIFQESF